MASSSGIQLYTDGSYNSTQNAGSWVCIIVEGINKTIIHGLEEPCYSHNRMEILAVIKGIRHVRSGPFSDVPLTIYSDSQYVVGLEERRAKLVSTSFKTSTGKSIRNEDLVRELLTLIQGNPILLVKVKAHQKKSEQHNYNREADQVVRKELRNHLKRRS